MDVVEAWVAGWQQHALVEKGADGKNSETLIALPGTMSPVSINRPRACVRWVG